MKYLLTLALSLIIIALASCVEAPQKATKAKPKKAPVQRPLDPVMAAGFKLLESDCFSCQNPNPDAQVHLAPSLAEIKGAYATGETDMKAFEEQLSRFINNPAIENVKMPQALE
jgi:hypothetical protein